VSDIPKVEVGSNIGATSRVWDTGRQGMTRSRNVLKCDELYQPWKLNVKRGTVVLTTKPCKHLRVGDHKLQAKLVLLYVP